MRRRELIPSQGWKRSQNFKQVQKYEKKRGTGMTLSILVGIFIRDKTALVQLKLYLSLTVFMVINLFS